MNREIKFRYVWRRKDGGKIWMEIVPLGCLERRGDTPFIHHDNSLWELVSHDEFTGLKDKNHREIYEGDIIRIVHHKDGEVCRGEMVFDDRHGRFGLLVSGEDYVNGLTTEDEANEVIGDIHEHPKLEKA